MTVPRWTTPRAWPRLLACALAACALAACTPADDPDAPMDWLHVRIDRLPRCPYGHSLEEPLIFELFWGQERVARSETSGMSLNDASLYPSLHVPMAPAGTYRLEVSACPSLLADLATSLACESPTPLRSRRVRLRPAGMDAPQDVRLPGWRPRCTDGSRARPR